MNTALSVSAHKSYQIAEYFLERAYLEQKSNKIYAFHVMSLLRIPFQKKKKKNVTLTNSSNRIELLIDS